MKAVKDNIQFSGILTVWIIDFKKDNRGGETDLVKIKIKKIVTTITTNNNIDDIS